MKPELIVMLSNQEKSVRNPSAIFNECRDLPVKCWGFTDLGLTKDDMFSLTKEIKSADKMAFMQILPISEGESLRTAVMAAEMGVDVILGTNYSEEIRDALAGKPIRYLPYVGHVSGLPIMLDGNSKDISIRARLLAARGISGITLEAYRYMVGDGYSLMTEVITPLKVPVIVSGSIDSIKRISEAWRAGAWGIAIGAAFHEQRFLPGHSVRENIESVWNWLQNTPEPL